MEDTLLIILSTKRITNKVLSTVIQVFKYVNIKNRFKDEVIEVLYRKSLKKVGPDYFLKHKRYPILNYVKTA
jgi:hypothetical protein